MSQVDDVRAEHAKYFIDRDGEGPFDYLGWCQYAECIESFMAGAKELREYTKGSDWISEILPRLRDYRQIFDDFIADNIESYDGEYIGVKDEFRHLRELMNNSIKSLIENRNSLESAVAQQYGHTYKVFLGYNGPLELLLNPEIDVYFEKDLELYRRVQEELKAVPELESCDYDTYISYVKANYPEVFDPDRYKKKFAATKAEAETAPVVTLPPKPVPSLLVDNGPPDEVVADVQQVREIAREEIQKAIGDTL